MNPIRSSEASRIRASAAREMRLHSKDAAQLLRALANPQRLEILCALAEGELTVSGLNARVDLSQSALSQHLAVLRTEGIVGTRREAQSIYYWLNAGPAARVMETLHGIFCESAAGAGARPRRNRRDND